MNRDISMEGLRSMIRTQIFQAHALKVYQEIHEHERVHGTLVSTAFKLKLAARIMGTADHCPRCHGEGVDPHQYIGEGFTRVCVQCNGSGKLRAVVMERVNG